MSNQTEVTNLEGGISPSSYTLKKAEIFQSNQTDPVDIRQMIMKMEFTESIGRPYIECTAFLQDAGNFLSTLKLNGNEKVSFIIRIDFPFLEKARGLINLRFIFLESFVKRAPLICPHGPFGRIF